MSTLTVQTLQAPTSGANANKVLIPSGQTLDASNGLTTPAGHVIQVKQSVMTGRTNVTTTSEVDVGSGNELLITPKFASSKMLVTFAMPVIMENTRLVISNLYRDSTSVNLITYYIDESSLDWQTHTIVHNFLDSPNTTNQIEYQAKWRQEQGNSYLNYSNTTFGLTNNSSRATMTAMEIAQ
jgi:hypothetical protein